MYLIVMLLMTLIFMQMFMNGLPDPITIQANFSLRVMNKEVYKVWKCMIKGSG